MNYVIFGGTGFIGIHLSKLILSDYAKAGDKVYALDIVMPGEEGVVPGVVAKIEGVEYVRCDVREQIELPFALKSEDIVFNFAAVHRTPGHPDREYFETNILGAENVTFLADKFNVKKILFTSSIAPYGAAKEMKKETSLPTPNTPYGISKLLAENIHQIWQARDDSRRLVIVRPGVVFGKGEHGNFTRLYWGIRKRYFMYTGRKDTIKACIYVKELVHFMMWQLEHQTTFVETFNCTFEPAYSIEAICKAIQKMTGMDHYIPLIPGGLMMTVARIVEPLGGKAVGIHPARVMKLIISTNICGEKLRNCGYSFHYTLEEAIADWFNDCEKKGLF